MTHPNNEIRCPYCGARQARVNAEVTAAMVTNVIDAIALPAVPGTIYVSENAEAHCAACENYSSFGAWQGMASHMPADVPEPTPAELVEQMRAPASTEEALTADLMRAAAWPEGAPTS